MIKKAIPNIDQVFAWENQAKQYPEHGTGIIYFKSPWRNGKWIDCLLYYGNDSLLIGILNYYPFDIFPYQKKGSVNIQVRMDKRRNGIATALLDAAITRFIINLKRQEYTPSGERFIKKYMRTSTTYRLSRQKFRLLNLYQNH